MVRHRALAAVALTVIAWLALPLLTAPRPGGRRRQTPPRAIPRPADNPDARVRDAGAGQMRNPPQDWDRVDEWGDESFPASDPPSTY
jgi:hypothetical protein